jgi:hypothetical protein
MARLWHVVAGPKRLLDFRIFNDAGLDSVY